MTDPKEKVSFRKIILICTDADKAAFAKITADQIVTDAGTFEDDMSVALKSRKVVID